MPAATCRATTCTSTWLVACAPTSRRPISPSRPRSPRACASSRSDPGRRSPESSRSRAGCAPRLASSVACSRPRGWDSIASSRGRRAIRPRPGARPAWSRHPTSARPWASPSGSAVRADRSGAVGVGRVHIAEEGGACYFGGRSRRFRSSPAGVGGLSSVRTHPPMTRIVQLMGALLGTFVGFGLGLALLGRAEGLIEPANRPAFLTAFVVVTLLFGYLAIPYITVYPARRAVDVLSEAGAGEFAL